MQETEKAAIVTVTLNPALDVTLNFSEFTPGAVNRVAEERRDVGGKGINVAKVIRALGNKVTVTGFLGRGNGAIFREYFEQNGINNRFLEVAGDTRANYKLVDVGNKKVTEINFPGLIVPKQALENLRQELIELANVSRIIVLSGSLPPNVPSCFYQEIIESLRMTECKVFLDASGEALAEGIKAKPFLVKPNLEELCQLAGKSLDLGSGLETVVGELLASGISQVVVSMGGRGALMATRESCLLVRPPVVQVGSTVGAGDALVAGLTVGEAREMSITERMRLATATAAASVMRPGTQAAAVPEIDRLLSQVIIEKI